MAAPSLESSLRGVLRALDTWASINDWESTWGVDLVLTTLDTLSKGADLELTTLDTVLMGAEKVE